VEKYSRARQATDDNMAHAHFTLDTKGPPPHTHTHNMFMLIGFPLQQQLHKRTPVYVIRMLHALYYFYHVSALNANITPVLSYSFVSVNGQLRDGSVEICLPPY
jgi:hypothetical protein